MTLTLTTVEARVVAALVEKSATTPQYYPLSVNALTAACNQKNGRFPVMSLTEGEVGAALNVLTDLRLVKREDQGSRVPKWRHRFNHELLMKEPVMAVLAALMLRGSQTMSELRASAESLGGPTEAGGVQAALKDLADRAQPLAEEIPRQPGQAAVRFRHLLTPGPGPGAEFDREPAAEKKATHVPTALEMRVAALEARVGELERQLGLGSPAT